MKPRILLTAAFLLLPAVIFPADPSTLMRQSIANVRSVHNCQYTFESYERFNGKMVYTKASFKIASDPFRVYMYQFAPDKGVELLYVKGANSGNAKINPGGFPWKILNINPTGSLALRNRHHPVTHAGFEYTAALIQYLLDKYKADNSRLITLEGTEQIHGAECHKLVLKNPSYKMVTYKTSEGETALSIAAKLKLNYVTLQDYNPSISGPGSVPAGIVLNVPNDYASGMEVFVRKSDLFPVRFRIFDQKGLFEDYLFSDVKINPQFSEKDFSAKNPDYGFN